MDMSFTPQGIYVTVDDDGIHCGWHCDFETEDGGCYHFDIEELKCVLTPEDENKFVRCERCLETYKIKM